ncbi:tellurium resistance protein TerC [Aestuariibacter halophilus]|uniref:Tellurium resistance protein TerC n=1 Tax=Fluctibacter halophilus TaxID=226011 RepID=A0ABS8G5D9_9ALTE|nr:PGPGW domain-containing protein [Aestuariibacter halophilus]MCC2615321.1 tellurium resistance protein TerC [Aestuariibacter halophilus]
MKKTARISLGAVLLICGVLFFVVPGSMLLVIAGLVLLSLDIPHARIWLKRSQSSMRRGAVKLDRILLARKLR